MNDTTPLADDMVGKKVLLLVDAWDDLRDDGLDCYLCAGKGETLVVRRVSASGKGFCVSHENITDRTFFVTRDEVEVLDV
jgi:hypothetical protein